MWEGGVKSGPGELVYQKTGYVIKGVFKDDTLEGEGTRTYASGKTVQGTWSQGQFIQGKMVNIDGTTYEGEWVGGRPHGTGVKVISGGKRYEGMFSLGRPWGKGAKVSENSRVEGYWDRQKFVEGQPSEEKLNEFNEQLEKTKLYYRHTKQFHMKEIPKTNYDCIKEEKLELGGITEAEMLERLSTEYGSLISQAEHTL